MDKNKKDTLIVYAYSFLSILHICVCQYDMTASPTDMIINLEDETIYFSGSFSCRNQLDCAQECFKQSHYTTFYYALFKRVEKLCVCANNFDWRKIAETASGANEVVRIGVREDAYECLSNPCIHGVCTDMIHQFSCECNPGYVGLQCEIDYNECISSPCVHGTCIDMVNQFSCSCYSGYEGYDCGIDINECASSPCVHGSCNNLQNHWSCNCDPGYEEYNCGYVCRTTYVGRYIVENNLVVLADISSAESCFDQCISFSGCNSVDFSDDGTCHLSAGSSRTDDLAYLSTDTFVERCVDI